MVGVDLGHLWGRSAETAGNVLETKEDDGDPPDCVKANQSWPVWCKKKTQRVDNIPLVSKQG